MDEIGTNKIINPAPSQFPFQDKALQVSAECVKAVVYENLGKSDFTDQLLTGYQKMVNKKSVVDLLPLVLYLTHATDMMPGVPLMSAWQLMRLAAKSFDDAEDESVQVPQLINSGTAFLFLSEMILGKIKEHIKDYARISKIIRQYNHACLCACGGQFLDLQGQSTLINVDPDTWSKIAMNKSGDLFAWAAWSGVYLAGVEESSLESYFNFGRYLGALVQVNDDFDGVWGVNGSGDLENFRVSLPYVYAFHVAPLNERESLLTLIEKAGQNEDLKKEIKEILINLGAQKFLLAVMIDLRKKALDALDSSGHNTANRLDLAVELLNKVCPPLVR